MTALRSFESSEQNWLIILLELLSNSISKNNLYGSISRAVQILAKVEGDIHFFRFQYHLKN